MNPPTGDDVLRVGNCSGFYGDRLSAMREMLDGGELDVLTGDYLAELTMLILGRDQMKDASLGYARTFVRQAEECMGLALEKGVRLVANAGGLNPAGLADRLREVADGLGLAPSIAHIEGDDVRALGFGGALTANVYLGGFGIAAALAGGADIVVTGRVTDASLVVGPAAWWHGWSASSYDALAGATVAGHVLECGTQATGGNFSGFGNLGVGVEPLGFPLAEIAADGSSVITKHAGTGGAVTVDTVTAQLMYEIQSARYLGPDVTTHLDSIQLEAGGSDRVAVSGIRGSAPPEQLKVCVNELGGFRNGAEFVLVGLGIEEKAAWVRAQVDAALAARPPASVEWSLARTDHEDATTEEAASCRLRLSVRDSDMAVVGKAFTAPLVELALGSYPGFTLTAPPAAATPYGIYRAEYIDRSDVAERVVFTATSGSAARSVPVTTELPAEPEGGPLPTAPDGGGEDTRLARSSLGPPSPTKPRRPHPAPSAAAGQAAIPTRMPLGTFVHARSGDKGGDANLGLWVTHDGSPAHAARVDWLLDLVTPATVVELVPEAEGLEVDVHPMVNLGGVNVVFHRLLGDGVAASSRFDPQAKALGEWVRSRHVEIPEELL